MKLSFGVSKTELNTVNILFQKLLALKRQNDIFEKSWYFLSLTQTSGVASLFYPKNYGGGVRLSKHIKIGF